MTKVKSKFFCVLISSIILGVMFSGCATEKETELPEDTADTEEMSAPAEGDSQPAEDNSEPTTLTDSIIGEEDGYGYELWKDSGDTTMVLTGDGTFTCEWRNINNALFRRGMKFDCTQTYHEIGNIAVDFNVDYHPYGNSYLCVYGWTREPLVEYYIVESWGTWRPPGAESMGTITVDGGVYDVYRTVRENQPSIDGTATFEQYWSVRKDKRTEGTVNVATHFAAWESMGMPMGKMYEAALTVEGYQSAGSAEVLKNELTVGGDIIEPDLSDLSASEDSTETEVE